MKVYLIRHADAGDAMQWTGDDSERPLSPLGQRQGRALGEVLFRQGDQLQAVVSSPLVRTRQTAEELLKAWESPCPILFNDLLAPGQLRKKKLARDLAELHGDSVAVIGHDPDLPILLGWFLDSDPARFHFKKGSAAVVYFEAEPHPGAGTLGWFVAPKWYLSPEGRNARSPRSSRAR